MSDTVPTSVDAPGDDPQKLVPVGESIRYRRRAQQAEQRAEQLEQQLRDTQAQLEQRLEQLGAAESQRDEIGHRLLEANHEHRLDRMLRESGVVDVEAATLLIRRRDDLGPDAEDTDVRQAVEQLLTDRPYLAGPVDARLGQTTAGARDRNGGAARLAEAARRAGRSGDRRDVAEYLRLRRELSD